MSLSRKEAREDEWDKTTAASQTKTKHACCKSSLFQKQQRWMKTRRVVPHLNNLGKGMGDRESEDV